ncbi:unnamed protein product [Cochlearia groenlandica]
MALTFLSHELSDLFIGKPPLRCLSAATSTVSDAIAALKSSDEPFLSVWSCCDHKESDNNNKCECITSLNPTKKDLSFSSALDKSVYVLLNKASHLVVHVRSSLK